jgi:hypothetical protein
MHYKIDINFIAKSVVSSVIMALVVWRLDPVGSVEILISVGVGSAVYFFCMIGLKGFSKKEINFLRDSLS